LIFNNVFDKTAFLTIFILGINVFTPMICMNGWMDAWI